MGWPSEVLVNQATVGANPMLQKLTQVVKAFATRKVALLHSCCALLTHNVG